MSTLPLPPPTRPVVLVIDDDPAIRTALELVFEDDYDVLTCASGPEGIALMDERVHVVILDIRLHGEDGFWTYEAIRKRFDRVPILFFSAFQGLKDPYAIINEYRPFGYLQKDGDLGELQEMVEEAVQQYASTRRRHRYLRVADRRAAVGTLAVGAAHEINNPLGFIVSNLEFIQETMHRNPAAFARWPALQRAVDDSLYGAWRIAKVVRDLQSFGRGSSSSPGDRADVVTACERAAQMAHPEIRHRARLISEHAELPEVAADLDTLGQIFVNLLVNAAQALPMGQTNRNYILVRSQQVDDRVLVDVTDSGPGVPEEIRDRIFDPFFSTKGANEGTGLGLFVAHSLVESVRGSLELVELPGEPGATFRVSLPVAPREVAEPTVAEPKAVRLAPVPDLEPEPEPEPAPAGLTARARHRILIVDDDVLVGRSLELVLPMHDTVYVESGALALERMHEQRFDVILCDVLMPQMSGIDLYHRIAASHPSLASRVVFMTGGVFDPTTAKSLDTLGRVVLFKPVATERLLETIESIAREGR